MPLDEEGANVDTSDRSAILDNYSSQLSIRDQALDRREYLLKRREKEVDDKWHACRQESRELEMMRSAIYQEKSAMRLTTAKRSKELSEAEKKQKALEDDLKGRVATVNDLLETSKVTAAELREKREELKQVNERLAYMHTTLQTAKKAVSELTNHSEEMLARQRKCAHLSVSLDVRKSELERSERNLSLRESEVSQREQRLAGRLEEADGVLSLKAILPDLRRVVNDYNDFQRNVLGKTILSADIPTVGSRSVEDEVRIFVSFFKDLRALAQETAAREKECAKKEDSLSERTQALAAVEAAISSREHALRETERSMSLKAREVEQQSSEAKAMLQRSEENSNRVAAQEERLQTREVSIQERENLLKERENHLSRQRKLLRAQENSLKRAGEAVKDHEAALAAESSQIEEMRATLQSVEDDVATREAVFKTREVELSVREAAVNVNIRRVRLQDASIPPRASESPVDAASLDVRLENSASVSGARANVPSLNISDINGAEFVSQVVEAHTRPQPGTNENIGANIPEETVPIAEDQNPGPSVHPTTVRKQLTFGFTPSAVQGAQPTQEGPSNAEEGSDQARSSDADSELAAEQLHNELKAARGLWIEKVNRLDSVVSSMSVDLTMTGAQLLPVIRNVRDELQRIRAEAMQEPEKDNSPASTAFAMEQHRHREWGMIMSAQLNTIKEVQAGLLHAFNRVLPSTRVPPGNGPLYSQRSQTSGYAQIEQLEPMRMIDSSSGTGKTSSESLPTIESGVSEAAKVQPYSRPKRKHRRGARRTVPRLNEASAASTPGQQKQFTVNVPGWKEFHRQSPRPPLTLLKDTDHLDAIRRELGLDPIPHRIRP